MLMLYVNNLDINLQVDICIKNCYLIIFCIKGATALRHSYFGHGEAPHILYYVECSSSGSYNSLLQCSYNTLGAAIHCGDGAVASVVCIGNTLCF